MRKLLAITWAAAMGVSTVGVVSTAQATASSAGLASASGQVSTYAGHRFRQIATGGSHACGLTTAGGVYCWGAGFAGQLGNGGTADSSVPTPVRGLSGGVAALGAGGNTSCAVTTAGALKCWGYNNLGQVGDGRHTCIALTTGAVRCWGVNEYGQLGDGTETDRLTPTRVTGLPSPVAGVAPGNDHTCARTTSGTAVCWGANSSGQLGDGTYVEHYAPAPVPGLTRGVVDIRAGNFTTCAETADGRLQCWGDDSYGALGNGAAGGWSRPSQVVGITAGVLSIDGGYLFTCAVDSSGVGKCWGLNDNGELGNGSMQDSTVPVTVR